MFSRYLILFVLFFGCSKTFAQRKISLELIEQSEFRSLERTEFRFRDSSNCEQFLQQLQKRSVKKGNLLFSIDSIERSPNNWSVFVYSGPKIKTLRLTVDEATLKQLRKSGLREKLLLNLPLKSREIERLLTQVRNSLNTSGYPFSDVYLDEIMFDNALVSGSLIVESGPLYTMNQVIVKGDSSIHQPLIKNLTGIKEGALYNEIKIQQTEDRLNQLSYLKVIKAPEILFTPKGADLYVYLQKIPVSSVNGIIGFQPNPIAQKLDITGELNLKLLNSLNRGERIQLQWQSIRDQTQNLDAQIEYPYLFNSNFGLEGNFELYKRDSTFLDFNFRGGVNYYFNNTSYLQAYYQGSRDNQLSGSANSSAFTSLGDASTNLYGLGIHSSRLDYLPNPRKGYDMVIEAGIGNRVGRIDSNSDPSRSLSYQGQFRADLYLPLYRRHVLKISNCTEFIGSENGIFQNERFRYGGQQSQRGFNEDELNATTRLTQSLEYRFLLDQNAFVFLFFDQTWYEDNSDQYLFDDPFGLGTGFSFSTDLGLFSLSYALGRQLNNPIRLAEGKIHFGYIAYF